MTTSPANRRKELFNAINLEQHFFRLFDHLEAVSFFAKDSEGRIVFADRSLLELYDCGDDFAIVGKTDFDLLPSSLAEKYRRDDLRVMETRKPLLNMVELFLNRQGIPGWFITNKLPLIGNDGTVVGVMGTIQAYGDFHVLQQVKRNVRVALEYIEKHYTAHFDVRQLAEIAGLSVRQFERVFQKQFNTTPQQYVIKRRIYDACDRLRGNEDLASIGVDLGFYDQSSFTRQFHKHMGMTPLQYRRRYR